MAVDKTVQCKSCKRLIYAKHADRDGNCCFCETPKPLKPIANDPAEGDKA